MSATVIPLTSCPVCYGYRLKLHRVTGDLLAAVRGEYAAHLASHSDRSGAMTPNADTGGYFVGRGVL